MSTLAKLIGAPRADVIDGYILSRPRLVEFATAEEEFARRYMTLVATSVADSQATAAAVVLTSAKEDILQARLNYGGSIFNIWALSSTYQPFLTFLCLRVKHGDKVTRESVEAMYEAGDQDKISEATLQLWGFLEPSKKDGGQSSQSPSTGPQSSDASTETKTADAA